MFHHKASIQVEYRYVPLVPVKPCPVLWKTDVYQLEDKLQRHGQAEREKDRKLCFWVPPTAQVRSGGDRQTGRQARKRTSRLADKDRQQQAGNSS